MKMGRMGRTEIRFAGFGGQGVISAGMMCGRAAALHDNKHAVLTQSYGPEARGGACNANLIISTERITYPEVDCPQLLVVMSQEAFTTYGRDLPPDGKLILDQDLVDLGGTLLEQTVFQIPATKIAESLGHKIVANVVMLGALVALYPIVEKEAMLQSVRESVPQRFIELNERAFEAGFQYAGEAAS